MRPTCCRETWIRKPKSRRNEPAYLPHIAATVAALRGEELETIGAATTRNAVVLFALTDS